MTHISFISCSFPSFPLLNFNLIIIISQTIFQGNAIAASASPFEYEEQQHNPQFNYNITYLWFLGGKRTMKVATNITTKMRTKLIVIRWEAHPDQGMRWKEAKGNELQKPTMCGI
jgi:hypothetical protein